MGLSFKRPISADVSIRAFGVRGDENANGWGLAWYPDRAAAIVKEPVRWGESPMTRFLEAYPALRAPIFLAHVRHGTTGEAPCYADTHPFSRERDGRDYCFAHNGTVKGPVWEFPTGRYRPLGATDSEQVFCHLLHEMDNRGGHLDDPESWRFLYERLAAVNRWGSLNVLFSDGLRLFCYHDLGAWKGLSFRSMDLGDRPGQHIGDAMVDFDVTDPQINHGVVVATYPLDGAAWDRIEPGELVVLEAGRMRHSSHREIDLATAKAGCG